jgi:hypothetical protein
MIKHVPPLRLKHNIYEKVAVTILRIMTHSIKGLFATLSIVGINIDCFLAEGYYVECNILFFVMLSVVMLNGIMLKVVCYLLLC